LSTNETTPFMFDIQESLSFRADAQLQDLIGIALEPDISIQEFEQEISVRGVIELTGEYHPVQDVVEGTAVAVSPGTRELEKVEKLEGGTNTFYHRFPVEISVPKYRIKQLKDVYVAIDNFDYDIPGSNVLELQATVAIYGVQEERRQVRPDLPEQPFYPDAAFQQAEPAQSYTEEIADRIEAESQEDHQSNQQGYQFFKEEQEQAESFADPGDAQQTGAYQFSQEEYAKSEEIEADSEEAAEENRDNEALKEQAYQFVPEYTEPAEDEAAGEAREEQANEGNQMMETDYQLSEEYTEAEERLVYKEGQDEQEEVPASPRVNIQSEKASADAGYEAEELQDETLDPEAEWNQEELFVLPDELEDAYQAADFRQANDEDVQYLDRELPHEEPAGSPDFTFTYQAKQADEAPRESEQVDFETPPLLTPEEDDRWKYKETKTFSEFFGSKSAEPTEVPQADLTTDEMDEEDAYEEQALPVNQELQPEDLEVSEVAEEAEEAAERKDSGNFLVNMFGAREETFTKVRVCIVQERDTLEKIATRYDVPVSSIASSNNLEEETVSEGQLLVIPQRRQKKN